MTWAHWALLILFSLRFVGDFKREIDRQIDKGALLGALIFILLYWAFVAFLIHTAFYKT